MRLRFVLLLLVSSNFSLAQVEVDSLMQLIKNSSDDSLKMEWYNELRRATYYSKATESFNFTKKYLELAEKNKYPKKIALGQYYLGNAYVVQSDYESALSFYLKSVKYYEKVGDSASLASIYNGIGAAYENYGRDLLSLKYFTKSHKIAEGIGDKRRSALALNNMANIYTNRGDLERSIVYLRKAMQEILGSNDDYVNPICVNLANALLDNDEQNEAAEIYAFVLNNINPNDDVYTYLLAMKGSGNIYLNNHNYSKAIHNLEIAFAAATQGDFLEQRYEIMPYLIEAYKGNNQVDKAFEIQSELLEYREKTFNEEKDKNLTEAIQKYESERKDKEIAEQNLHIANQRVQKKWFIGGTVGCILLALVIFLIFRSRLKFQKTINRQNNVLQEKQITELEQNSKLLAMNSMLVGEETERLRIAKDLHDGLGGLLSTIKTHFSMLKIEKAENQLIYSKTNELIDSACVDIRRISHNMMPHALTISGLEAAISDLGESLRLDSINVIIEINKIPKALSSTTRLAIYRLFQQLTTNIREHAQAKNVLLQMLIHNDVINITIEDDGIGFDLSEVLREDGIGIQSIYSRINYLNGTIDIDSIKNKGTTILIEIPI